MSGWRDPSDRFGEPPLPKLRPWQVRTIRIVGIVLVVGFSAAFWMLLLHNAMRAIGP